MPTALMMSAALFAADDTESLVGKIRVAGSSIKRVVSLVVHDEPVHLKGELVSEVQRLASVKVEVVGKREGEAFLVQAYRILDVGGGAKPLVGILIDTGKGALALKDGEGSPIPLSMPARSKARLLKKIGAKMWAHGRKLVSGELKVLRYGILREPRSRGVEKETKKSD